MQHSKHITIIVLFSAALIGGIVQIVTSDNWYTTSYVVFVTGLSSAVLVGALAKYFSQEAIDLRDMRREKQNLKKYGCRK
jgi:hypothetical protein